MNDSALSSVLTSKTSDVKLFVVSHISDGNIIFPSASDVNKVFLSLPKGSRDKTTYGLLYTMASLSDAGKLQYIFNKAASLVADRDTKAYLVDKAADKMLTLVKAYINLGADLIKLLAE